MALLVRLLRALFDGALLDLLLLGRTLLVQALSGLLALCLALLAHLLAALLHRLLLGLLPRRDLLLSLRLLLLLPVGPLPRLVERSGGLARALRLHHMLASRLIAKRRLLLLLGGALLNRALLIRGHIGAAHVALRLALLLDRLAGLLPVCTLLDLRCVAQGNRLRALLVDRPVTLPAPCLLGGAL
ncbi:MAG: hypothetical protein JWN66_3676, partial [Sphingomonas bacterium]|uniref:hypothetical protein n=1 Tax=Sphingomonas bacterium TaxID=1895847 RepID=UPI00261E806E